MKYKMKTSAGTQGAVSKKWRSWTPGQILDLPPGEFVHLEPKHYEIISEERKPAIETADANFYAETADISPVNATQGAISFAAENGIDLSEITGTGAGGKITKPDVENALR